MSGAAESAPSCGATGSESLDRKPALGMSACLAWRPPRRPAAAAATPSCGAPRHHHEAELATPPQAVSATEATTLTAEQMQLLQASWSRLVGRQDRLAASFYTRLFRLDNELQQLFTGDMHEQGCRLTLMLATALQNIADFDRLLPTLRDLGARHARYGTVAAHYGVVGAALLWALGEQLEAAFTPDVEAAWTEFYLLIANTMQGL